MKSILEILGGKETVVPSTKDEEKPAGKLLERIDSESIMRRYANFGSICDDVPQLSDSGAELLNSIINDKNLFRHYICRFDNLKKLLGMCPAQIDAILENIKSDQSGAYTFLGDFGSLFEINELFKKYKGRLYRNNLVKHALSDRKISLRLLNSKEAMERGFRLLPNFKTTILEILANDSDIFAACMHSDLKYFCQFSKEHKKYTARFVRHVFTSDRAHRALLFHSQGFRGYGRFLTPLTLDYFIVQFPDALDRLIDFIVADDDRFQRMFPTFGSIYHFSKKHPRHLEKLFAKAVSMPSYVEICISEDPYLLFKMHKSNPAHAELLETMVIANPEWIFALISSTPKFREVCTHGAFSRLRDTYLTYLYVCPKHFKSHVSEEASLDNMIEVVPDQSTKLKLYFKLIIQKKSISQIINAEYTAVATMEELNFYIARCIKVGTIDGDTIKSLREQVAGLLDFIDDDAPHFPVLSDLKAYLSHSIAPKVAALLHKDLLMEQSANQSRVDSAYGTTSLPRTH